MTPITNHNPLEKIIKFLGISPLGHKRTGLEVRGTVWGDIGTFPSWSSRWPPAELVADFAADNSSYEEGQFSDSTNVSLC